MKTDPKLKDFIMTVGLPGSGKSSYALATFPNHVYLSSDSVISSVAAVKNVPYTDAYGELIDPALKFIEAQLIMASWAVEDILLDQTNLTPKARKKKLDLLLNKDKYWKVALVFDTPKDLLKLRLTKRESSGMMLPKSAIKRLASSFKMPTLEEGFDEIKVISVQ